MGLFSKDKAVDKKLKELTGGFLLSSSFVNRLKMNNLNRADGTRIRDQIKKEIKQGSLNEFNLEARLDNLIDQYSNKKTVRRPLRKKCPKCSKSQNAKNSTCIHCGHKFHISETSKKCPKCNKLQEEDTKFCINCGYEFIDPKKNKECPICHEVQDADNKVCINCKYDFEHKKIKPKYKNCPNCGKRLFNRTKKCINCGYDFKTKQMPDEYLICPECNVKTKKSSKKCPKCGHDYTIKVIPKSVIKTRKISFLANYEFNLKTCPDCNTQFLKTDPFCFNCGSSVITRQTIKNDNLEVKDGRLVAKEEWSMQNDELDDLEALYSQTVKSKYAPSFKVAYVLYLDWFRKNPTKKFSDKIAKHYDTTVNKLKKQALEDEFIELASPLIVAKESKVSELKEILKQHNLKVSGRKDELIERLGDNLSQEELKKYFKSKIHQISDEGLEFLSKNNYIIYIYNNKDILRVFSSSEIVKIFEEKEYDTNEIQDIILKYLKRIFDKKLSQELWVDFKIYANAIASVLEDKNLLEEALNIRLKVFLFDINNFSIVLGRPDPRKTKLKQKDISKLTELLHNLSLSIDELKELFNQSYNEVLFDVVITKEDSLVYLLKIFAGEDLVKVSSEINDSYSNPY